MRNAPKIAAVCALVLSLGGHWALLQTVAWTGMVIRYSRNASLQEAVARTFDGKHPCTLCKAIQKGRAQEHQRGQPRLNPTLKLDFAVVWQAVDFEFASAREPIVEADWSVFPRHEAPPKPPPRLA